MRKILILIITIIYGFNIQAQVNEPKNNLGKNISQLRSKFPSLTYKEQRGNLTEYESDGIDFTFKDGVVVAESMGINGGKSFCYDWFCSMEKAFLGTQYKRETGRSNNGMVLTRMFYYSDFWITLSYWLDDGYAIITYQSSDYFK